MSITNEKLQTIKDNVSKVYRSGQMDVIKNANSLKGFESNKAMLLDDVSPVTHEMGVRVRKVNLFDVSKIQSINGITNNGDGTLTLVGGKYAFNTKVKLSDLCPDLKVGDTVFLSATTTGTGVISFGPLVWTLNRSYKVTEDDFKDELYLYGKNSNASDFNEPHTISNIQIEYGEKATTYMPYVPNLTAVKVTRCGKNLFNKSISFTDTNHYVSIGGGYKKFKLYVGIGTAITVSLSKKYTDEDGKLGGLCVYPSQTSNTGGKWLFLQNNAIYNHKEANMISTDGYITLKIDFDAYKSFKDELQIEIGTTATYYEPYITPTDYTPTADGTVNGVTSLYPNITLTTDTDGVVIDCEYYKDVDKAYNKLSAAIALSGGE